MARGLQEGSVGRSVGVRGTLSDAKIEEDAKQKKKWAVVQDRLQETWKARACEPSAMAMT